MTQVRYVGDARTDGMVVGRTSSSLVAFWGGTPAAQQAVVTTVDSTTITAVQVATATLTHVIGACNSLITDSRAQAKALNQLITKLATIGILASS